MQIIQGQFKAKRLVCASGTRPVAVHLRKSCFDILGSEVSGKHILDLFAGTGALGLEALSLGAATLVCIDKENQAVEAIRANIATLGCALRAGVYLKEAVSAVRDFFTQRRSFDIIFVDPPYYQGILRKALQALEEYDIVTPFGYVVGFCYHKDEFLKESKRFSLLVEKKYGQTLLLIYRREENLNA